MSYRFLRRLRLRLRQRFGVLPLNQSRPDLREWLQTPLGEALLEQERVLLEANLQDLFGYHLLQMSIEPALDLTAGSRIPHRFSLAPQLCPECPLSTLVASYRAMPLPAESLDLVLLHHLLDYTPTPHQLLREAARVLIPRGHLVIVGFSPWSLFGFGRFLAALFSSRPRWRQRGMRLGRLLDWLQLLDLEAVSVDRGFFRPPVQSPGLLHHLHWLERWGKKLHLPTGGVYVVVARKDIGAMTPIKPRWELPKAQPGFAVKPMRKNQKPENTKS